MTALFRWTSGLLICCVLCLSAHAERIRDLTTVQGVRENQLIGYGLVVGPDGAGDQTTPTPFTPQTITTMLSPLRPTVPGCTYIQLIHVAAVMFPASSPALAQLAHLRNVVATS